MTTGKNILHMKKGVAEYASGLGIAEESLRKTLERSKVKLLATRGNRVKPHLDGKVLTSWNGLMIAALAKAGRALGEPRYTEAASRTVDFILSTMRTPESRLLHRYRDGDASIPGFLEDYAFLVWGLLEMYESTFDSEDLGFAVEINEATIRLFWDERPGEASSPPLRIPRSSSRGAKRFTTGRFPRPTPWRSSTSSASTSRQPNPP